MSKDTLLQKLGTHPWRDQARVAVDPGFDLPEVNRQVRRVMRAIRRKRQRDKARTVRADGLEPSKG